MAQIPILDSSRVAPAAAPAALLDTNVYGAVGRAMAGLGQDIANVGSTVGEFYKRKQNAQDDASLLNADVEWGKMVSELNVWKESNADWGSNGEKLIEKQKELLAKYNGSVLSDKTMSNNARKKLQLVDKERSARLMSQGSIDANMYMVKQSKLKMKAAQEFAVQNEDRTTFVNTVNTMLANGLITPVEAEIQVRSGMRNIDLTEANRKASSDNVVVLNDLHAGIKNNELSYLSENDKRIVLNHVSEQKNRIQTRNADGLSGRLAEEGVSVDFMEDLERQKEADGISGRSYSTLKRRADGLLSASDNVKLAHEYYAAYDAILSDPTVVDSDKMTAAHEFRKDASSLKDGPEKRMVIDMLGNYIKENKQQKPKDYGVDLLKIRYDNDTFGKKVVPKKKANGKPLTEAERQIALQKSEQAYKNYVELDEKYQEWRKKNSKATRAEQLAFIDSITQEFTDVNDSKQINLFGDTKQQ